ncbi:methyl-accepting chemotaxis protein [Sphingomonas sp. BK580]|uniref:methyl-accepting chemotaxis protein n=1 Tax=Sphingomonas sp. BK580 TaxID=2586972 RepID=UPI00181C5C07|nr:methyl-accepting chemotaxis protein [Sphingomonas sp. BK580]MBB3692956.1 methyl-accepting chemotaxis protein [Sphingomonas sp. BK580]
MNQLRIAPRLVLSFAVIFVVMLGINLLALANVSRIDAIAEDIGAHRRLNYESISALGLAATQYRLGEAGLLTARDGAEAAAATEELAERGRAVESGIAELNGRLRSPVTQGMLREFAHDWATYRATEARPHGGAAAARLATFRARTPAFADVARDSSRLLVQQSGSLDTGVATARALADEARLITFVAMAVTALLVIVMLALLIRGIARPLDAVTGALLRLADGDLGVEIAGAERGDEVGDVAAAAIKLRDRLLAADEEKTRQTALIVTSVGAGLDSLARGDLTTRVDTELEGAFGKLRTDFNAAIGALAAVLAAVQESAAGISDGAADILQATDDLSHRTEKHAAGLEQTSAALQEITATVRQTADGVARVNGVVGETRGDAERSGEVVRRAVEAMSGIQRASHEIGDIISVIDGIAFQTNLLALNAGVEAARAGDAGRGFAVVAQEVRALAQRSAEAARDVKKRIGASTEQVGAGAKLVVEAGDALTRIIARVGEIGVLVGQIAEAAEQQSTGLVQVSKAIAEMDGVTQQNAAMVEQTTAAARALAGEADALAQEVACFLLDRSTPTRAGMPSHRQLEAPRRRLPKPAPRLGHAARARTADDDGARRAE